MVQKLPDISPKKYGLLEYHELPKWRRMNESITGGYLPINNSYRRCLSSLTFLHNETGGQYTHFLPFLLATAECIRLIGILYGWVDAPYNPRREDVLVFGAFFLGAFTCMGLSTSYHLLMSHSEAVATFAKQLDFVGIISLIWGSLVPIIYYAFTCEVPLMRKYLATVSVVSLAMAAFLLSPLARQSWSGALITPGFVALSASGIIPLAHAVRLYGWHRMSQMVGIEYVLAQGALYCLGLLCMLTYMPERAKPGKFNIWGQSHQLFHAAVVVAAFVHYRGMKTAFLWQHSYPQAVVCPMKSLWKDDVIMWT